MCCFLRARFVVSVFSARGYMDIYSKSLLIDLLASYTVT